MPGKSRRGKGKHSFQTKVKKGKSSRPTTVAQPPITAQPSEPVSHPRGSAPVVSVPAPVAKPAVAQYPYIATEMRMIGIVGGLMLVILVVLALVLS